MQTDRRQESAGLQKRLLENAAKLFSATTFSSLLSLISFVLTARILGPTEFGMLMLVATFGNAVTMLCGFQAWQGIIKFASEHLARGDKDSASRLFQFTFTLDIAAAVLAGCLVFFGAGLAADLFSWRVEVEDAARFYAVAVVFSITGSATAALRLLDHFGVIAFQQVAAASLRLLIVVVIVLTTPTFTAFLWGWIISQVAAHILLNLLAWRSLKMHGLTKPRNAPERPVINAHVWRYLITSNLDGMVRVVRELDAQIVAAFIDEAAAGLLRVGRQIAAFVGRLGDAFFEAIYPQLMELVNSRNWQSLYAFISQASLQAGALSAVPLIVFVLVGSPLLNVMFGEAYAEAYIPTLILIASMVVWGFSQAFSPALMAFGAIRRMLVNHIVAAVVYFWMLITLVPEFSATGAALAMLGLYVVWGALTGLTYLACRPGKGDF